MPKRRRSRGTYERMGPRDRALVDLETTVELCQEALGLLEQRDLPGQAYARAGNAVQKLGWALRSLETLTLEAAGDPITVR